MNTERKTLKFEVKEVDEEAGTFEGYGATFSDKPDSYGDIIDAGAFTKTLKEGGKRIKILWQHNVHEPIGKPAELAEDEKGLWVKGKLSLGVQRAREVLSLMKDGVITELSIGYDTLKQSFAGGIRHLKEVKLYDISLVTFAANPEAVIARVKTATTFDDLPLADREKEWDGAACERRVRVWAGGIDNMNWDKYRRAFFWYDEDNPELLGSYKLGFADAINGRLTAIPRGIFACAVVLRGGRGGVQIPADDKQKVIAHINKYYAKMDMESPFKSNELGTEYKPMPNFHACRLRDPDDFQEGSFRTVTRRSDDKEYSIIMGRLEGETTMTEQSYRYGINEWTASEALNHCEEHDGQFEPAKKGLFQAEYDMIIEDIFKKRDVKSGRVLSAASMDKVRAALEALQALVLSAERELEPDKSTLLSKADEEAAELERIVSTLKGEQEDFEIKNAERRIEALLAQIKN